MLEGQDGVLTRQQAYALGVSPARILAHLDAGRWRRVLPRVYATFTGPLPRRGYLWAVVLWAGPGAVLSHETAAELCGLVDEPSTSVHVTIPSGRRIRRRPGVVVHLSALVRSARHPARTPPQTTVEDTVIDLTQRASRLDEALSWVARACGRRLTTPQRLAEALRRRTRVRWRAELAEVLGDVRAGCHSLLELRYLRAVERAHGLPRGHRQAVRRRAGGRWYDDVHYERFGTRVELDGRVAHPDEARWRDATRDNAAAVGGEAVLRYGWGDVVDRTCGVAAQVAAVLIRGGWSGRPARCGPRCVITKTSVGQDRPSITGSSESHYVGTPRNRPGFDI